MRIYLYRYGSICEPDIIDSFKRIGFDIYEETIEITNLLENEQKRSVESYGLHQSQKGSA